MPHHLHSLCGILILAVVTPATSPSLAAHRVTAHADKSAEVATRGQREAKDVTYGDWQKICFKAGGAPKLCRTSITGTFPTGQTAMRVDLIEREDSPTARLQLFMPVGMYLQQPPKVMIDKGSARRFPYNWCATNTCIAADVADPAMVKEMESGKTLTLEVVDANLLALTTSIPLTNFASVHKGAPVKTLEQYVDE
ncbi:invasion associated locus B family protein [Bradyrhizobium guangzhouense]|uniref:invasion associated locus B family protein n=1 Tax=Bradyrhizobium guangzhouense TaxID=1325095 RepID=UPI0010099E51|nr:invasion associated locus B family protein [Bradyrhizobium guangzhouense]RXH15337.1 invasion associated locus B family protein [Bradyrhizobium guangzhouense]